jgi:hypothetical protein
MKLCNKKNEKQNQVYIYKVSMNFSELTKCILCETMDIVSTELNKDKEQYDRFVEETKRVTEILKKKVAVKEKKMWDINVALKLLDHKSNGSLVENKILYSSIGESLLVNIFTEDTWKKRHLHYMKLMKQNNLDMNIFKSQMTSSNIVNAKRVKYFEELLSNRELVMIQLLKDRSFFRQNKNKII